MTVRLKQGPPAFVLATPGSVTLAILKPDVIKGNLMEDLMSSIVRNGFTILAKELRILRKADVEFLYAEHRGKEFYPRTFDFMVSGPSVILALEHKGHGDSLSTQGIWRNTFMPDIRSFYGNPYRPRHENLVHGSDSPEAAVRELSYFFGRFK